MAACNGEVVGDDGDIQPFEGLVREPARDGPQPNNEVARGVGFGPCAPGNVLVPAGTDHLKTIAALQRPFHTLR